MDYTFHILSIRSEYVFWEQSIQKEYLSLTHLCPVSKNGTLGNQCRPRSDAAERGIVSGSSAFALNTVISVKRGNTKN